MKHSKQTKLKMRLAHLGKKQSPEHVRNAAASHRGKKRTEEQCKTFARKWTKKQRKERSIQRHQIFMRDGMSHTTRQKLKQAVTKSWIARRAKYGINGRGL